MLHCISIICIGFFYLHLNHSDCLAKCLSVLGLDFSVFDKQMYTWMRMGIPSFSPLPGVHMIQ